MRIVVAITGASGVIYGKRLLESLAGKHELHVVVSEAAKKVAEYEGDGAKLDITALRKLIGKRKGSAIYEESDMAAPIASGSFKTDAMVVIPCSTKTLSGIANGYTENLVIRAADVMLKEHRKLVLVLRETPLSPIVIGNMLKLANIGVVILPACPGFYSKPKTISDMVDFVVGKALDSAGIDNNLYKRWTGKK